jgi:hypothetical protein
MISSLVRVIARTVMKWTIPEQGAVSLTGNSEVENILDHIRPIIDQARALAKVCENQRRIHK